MATIVTCDVCGRRVEPHAAVKIEVRDGEHPHNGSVMHKDIDVCLERCIRKVPNLSSSVEFDKLRAAT